MVNKKDKERVSQEWNIYFRYLNQDKSVSIDKLTGRYNHFSLPTYVECYQRSFFGVLKNTFLGIFGQKIKLCV